MYRRTSSAGFRDAEYRMEWPSHHRRRGSDIPCRVSTILSTRRCMNPRSLVSRTLSPQMAITRKHITERYRIVRSIACVCRRLLIRPHSSKPCLPSRHHTMATRDLPKTIKRLTYALTLRSGRPPARVDPMLIAIDLHSLQSIRAVYSASDSFQPRSDMTLEWR